MPIATYNVTGIADGIAAIGEKRVGLPNVTLIFTNDMNGMVSLKDSYMKIRYQYQEEVEIEKPKNVIKRDEEGASEPEPEKKEGETESVPEKKEGETESEPEKKEGEPEPEPEKKEGEAKPEPEKKEGEAKPEPATEKKETVMVTKRKIRKIALRVKPIEDRLIIKPLSEEERKKSIAL